jgi:hypothetical protein
MARTDSGTTTQYYIHSSFQALGSLPETKSSGENPNTGIPHVSIKACKLAEGRWDTCFECELPDCQYSEDKGKKK